MTQCIGLSLRPGVHGTRRVLEQTRRVQGNLLMVEDELDELFIQLGESDEGSFDVHIEEELVESLPNSTIRVVDSPTRRVGSTGS